MRPIQTRFRCASGIHLKLHYRITRWIVLQKARRHGTSPLRLLVGTQFQVLFHSPPGVLFTFPSRYLFTIGRLRVFSLGGWSSQIQTGFLVPRPTQETTYKVSLVFVYAAFTLYG